MGIDPTVSQREIGAVSVFTNLQMDLFEALVACCSFLDFVSTLTHPQTKKINVTGSGVDLGKSYMQFVRNNMDTITKRINDDLWVLNVMEKWYFDQVQMISTWLTDRLDKTLIPYQCTCLAHVVKVGGGQ